MLSLAVVVMTGALTIDDGTIEIGSHHILDGLNGRSGMNGDAQLTQHLHGTGTQSAANSLCSSLLLQKARHSAMGMLGSSHHARVDDVVVVINGEECHLRRLAEVWPQFTLCGRDCDFFHCHCFYCLFSTFSYSR